MGLFLYKLSACMGSVSVAAEIAATGTGDPNEGKGTMSANAPPPPGPAVWQAQYLRLIAFPTQPHVGVDQHWWTDLTGAESESTTRKRHEREEQGPFEGAILSLSIDLVRIQWTANPRIDENQVQMPPTVGAFGERQAWFRGLMERWLEQCPEISRLAFACLLLQPVESREVGYETLNRYLRWVDIDPQSSDFMYRINRRRESAAVPGLSINRLGTWSVGRFVEVEAQIGPPGVTAQIVPQIAHACALELDVNTVPEPANRILPHQNLPRLFGELVDLGIDIATHGDVRP